MRCLFTVFLLSLVSSFSVAGQFREGIHYLEMDREPTVTPMVMLFHSPYCGPCAMVHDPILKLASDKGMDIKEVVVPVGKVGNDIQQGYVVAKRQNKAHAYIKALIRRIHFTKDDAPRHRKDVLDVLDDCGVDASEFETPSLCIKDEVGEHNLLVRHYRIRQTPTIIVNGNKQIILPSLKNMDELEALISELYQG